MYESLYSQQDYERLASIVSRLNNGSLLIDPRSAPDHIRELVEGYYREQFWLDGKVELQHTKQPRILFGISSELKCVRAFASQTPEWPESFIILNLQLITQIVIYFNMVMCHPKLLSEWGDATQEEWPRPAGENDVVVGFAPHNNERTLICRLLQRMALRFIISHELVHILHGHLAAGLATSSGYHLDETLRSGDEDDALAKQALEIDADLGAIPECFGDSLILTDTFNDGVRREWLDLSRPLLMHEKTLQLWFFAIYSLFRIMSDRRIEPPLRRASHPRPMFRVLNFNFALDAKLQQHGRDDLREGLAKAFGDSISNGKHAFRTLGVSPIAPDTEDDLAFGSFGNYVVLVNNKWTHLRPALTPHKTIDKDLPTILVDFNSLKFDKIAHHAWWPSATP